MRRIRVVPHDGTVSVSVDEDQAAGKPRRHQSVSEFPAISLPLAYPGGKLLSTVSPGVWRSAVLPCSRAPKPVPASPGVVLTTDLSTRQRFAPLARRERAGMSALAPRVRASGANTGIEQHPGQKPGRWPFGRAPDTCVPVARPQAAAHPRPFCTRKN